MPNYRCGVCQAKLRAKGGDAVQQELEDHHRKEHGELILKREVEVYEEQDPDSRDKRMLGKVRLKETPVSGVPMLLEVS